MKSSGNLPIPDLPENQQARFWSLVDKCGPMACWLWKGMRSRPNANSKEYGIFNVTIDGKDYQLRAHRVTWTQANGPIPEGLDLDHKYEVCSSTLCCNPNHTEPVTVGVNVKRYYLSRTHCKRGHPIVQHGKPCNTCKTLGKQRERERKKNGNADLQQHPHAALINSAYERKQL